MIYTPMATLTDTEIQVKFKGIEDSLSRIENTGENTLKQATMTNGKVASLVGWRERVTGALWAYGSCLTLIIIPLAGYVLWMQATEPQRTRDAAKDAVTSYFSQYNVQIK